MKNYKYLLEYANAQIGRPYWCGTWGQVASANVLKRKRAQYPTHYTQPDYKYIADYGRKVHDCCGLIKGALWSNTPNAEATYNGSQDHSVKGFYNAATTKGRLNANTKLVNGMLLFNSSFGHVGIYDNGYVVNAKGRAYGVVKEKYIAGRWYYWALCNYFDYSDEPAPSGDIKAGDIVTMSKDATVYGKSTKFASWVYDSKLTVIERNGNRCVVSVAPEKGVTGAVHVKYLTKVR